MSDVYTNRTNRISTSIPAYFPRRTRDNYHLKPLKNPLDEEEMLLNDLIGKERSPYRRPLSPLTGNEPYGQMEDLMYYDDSGYLDNGYGYQLNENELNGTYTSPPWYRCDNNPEKIWNTDFTPISKCSSLQNPYGYYRNSYKPQLIGKSASFDERYRRDDLRFANIPHRPIYQHRYVRYGTSNFEPSSRMGFSVGYNPQESQGVNYPINYRCNYGGNVERNIRQPHGINESIYYQNEYYPPSLGYVHSTNDKNQTNFDFLDDPQYSGRKAQIRRSYPYRGTIERGTDVNIDQIPFECSTAPNIKSPRIQITQQSYWLPFDNRMGMKNNSAPTTQLNVQAPNFAQERLLPRPYLRPSLSENLSKAYTLRNTPSPLELERGYGVHTSTPWCLNKPPCNSIDTRLRPLSPVMNRTKTIPSNLNRPANRRRYFPIAGGPRQNIENGVNPNLVPRPQRASFLDISSLSPNEIPEVPIYKSYSDSSIDMTDDSTYMHIPSKPTSNFDRLSYLPSLEEVRLNTNELLKDDYDYNQTDEIYSAHYKKRSPEYKRTNHNKTLSVKETNNVHWKEHNVEDWKGHNVVDNDEEKELEELADNLIQKMTEDKSVMPLFSASGDLQDDTSSKTYDESYHSETPSQKIDAAAQIEQDVKTKGVQVKGSKMKELRPSRSQSRRRKVIEEMYKSITEDHSDTSHHSDDVL